MDRVNVAQYWEHINDNVIKCNLCPLFCKITDGHTGMCGVRTNVKGTLFATSYGHITAIALDPIEKKPLTMFYPGSTILSVGSYGCNLKCQFCQNYRLSMEYKGIETKYISPEQLVEMAITAKRDGNIGIAHTYNEPLIAYEYIKDCSIAIKNAGLKNVLVTNGYINEEPLKELLPYVDAMNIDLKGSTQKTYDKVRGTLEDVLNVIKIASETCHVEVTTLVIPNENEDEVEDIAKIITSIDPSISYHISRFFPRYNYSDKLPTSSEVMYRVYEKAKPYLKNIYLRNM